MNATGHVRGLALSFHMSTLGGPSTTGRARSTWLAIVAALTVMDGCCDAVAPVILRRAIAKLAGDNQTAAVGEPVAIRPSVRVTNQRAEAVAGVAVTFAVVDGGGSVTDATQTTDANGVATVGAWILGSRPGPNSLSATASGADIEGNPVAFSATARAGSPASLIKHAGDGQTGTVAQRVAVPPAVRITDRFDNPVPGTAVMFAVSGGGGQVGGAQTTTDANGVAAAAAWTLGALAGPNTLLATAAGPNIRGNPATFTAIANAGPAASIAVMAGDSQQAQVGQPVPIAPAVVVRDQFGNPVAGIAVTFAVTMGGGNVAGPNQTTNAAGQAAPALWTLGTTAGSNRLTATAAGANIAGNPVAFTATAVAGPPASLAAVEGDNQQAPPGQPVPIPPAVVVRDQFGNPVPGVAVDYVATSGGGSVAGPNQTTGTNGVARVGSWILGQIPGTNTLTARATGGGIQGNPVVFTAIAR